MRLLGAVILTSLAVAQSAVAAEPPVAEKRPFMVTSPNGAREDDYYQRDDTRKVRAEIRFFPAPFASCRRSSH
jgi:oligopeptidase B